MDEEQAAKLDAVEAMVTELHETLTEFLPLLRAYLDPEQTGPRGYFMRKRLAQTNGSGHD